MDNPVGQPFINATSTPPMPPPPQEPVTTAHLVNDDKPKQKINSRVVATLFGLLVLVGAISAGAIVVNNQNNKQLISQKAAAGSCSDICSDLNSCNGRGGSWTQATTSVHPECQPQGGFCAGGNNCGGGGGGSGSNWISAGNCITVTSGSVHLERFNGPNCPTTQNQVEDNPTAGVGTYCTTPSQGSCQQVDVAGTGGVCSCDTTTSTPIPTSTPTATPTATPGVSAVCTNVAAFDTNWNPLTQTQLSQLQVGTIIYFTVKGTTSGTFDSARFTINSVLEPITLLVKPGEPGTYYFAYQIKANVTTVTVQAQLHSVELNDWF